jgi:multiple sugar transport system substrate-binding protein
VEGKLIDPNPADVVQLLQSSAYRKAVVDYMTYGGQTYGIPMLDGSLASLYYNKDMFKAAGLDPEKPPTTFDEMMADAQKLVQADSAGNITRSGMSMRLSGQGSGIAEKFWFYLHNMGGDIIVPTKDGTKWHNGYNNDAGRKALKYYIDSVYTNHVVDQKVKSDAEAFETEQTAMLLRESWVVAEIATKNPKLNYGVAPMPRDVKWDTLSQPSGVYVAKCSKNQDLAWEYAKLVTNQQNAIVQVQKTGWISPRADADWASLVKATPQLNVFVNPPKEMGYYFYPLISSFDEVETKMADQLVKAYLDASLKNNPDGIAKTIQTIADETDSILKQAGVYGTD